MLKNIIKNIDNANFKSQSIECMCNTINDILQDIDHNRASDNYNVNNINVLHAQALLNELFVFIMNLISEVKPKIFDKHADIAILIYKSFVDCLCSFTKIIVIHRDHDGSKIYVENSNLESAKHHFNNLKILCLN